MTAKTPVTIVTGFLGAGKTTLIRHLLTHAKGRRLALIVNEFGDLGVDGDILRSCGADTCDEGAIIELANGCICCTVADDFAPAIEMLLKRDPKPDHIIVETSGLALPKPLIKAFDWPELRAKLTVDGVIAVVDAAAVSEGRFADDPDAVAAQRAADPSLDHDNPLEEVYEDQLLCADLVVLNKTDLLDRAELVSLRQQVKDSIPRAVKVIATSEGKLDPDVLLGLHAAAEDDLADHPSHHDAEPDHDHDDFHSFVVEIAPLRDVEAMVEKLEAVAQNHDVLRMKGFLAVEGKPMRLLVQGVGARFRREFDRAWVADEVRRGRLVVIGERNVDEAAIRAALAR